MTAVVRRRAIVSGDVQGVFFRDSCRRLAAEHGVTGWARNLPDGTVEVIVEGAPGAVNAVLRWCEQGPPYAEVYQVEVTEEAPTGAATFEIR